MDAITESPGRYWPVSQKYDTVDGKYKFFKALNLWSIQCQGVLNTALLKKLSNCFPNVETLHMDGIKGCSIHERNREEWREMLEVLFGDESIFSKMKNFFMGSVEQYSSLTDEKLSVCKCPLNLLCMHNGATEVNFNEVETSQLRSTLTELYLGYCIETKIFNNLCNLEELRIDCGGEDCDLTVEGMIDLFTLPLKEPRKSFPYKLKHQEIAEFYACRTDLLKAIDRNCTELRTPSLAFNEYMGDDAMPFIVSNFKHLVSLDLSNLRDCYKDEVWNNLNDDDLPDLHLLKLHGNKNLQRLNLKRPKLLISSRLNYFINWTETENGYVFHDTFDGDIRAIENDIRQIDGFRDFKITSQVFIYDSEGRTSMARTLSYDGYPFSSGEKQPYEISIGDSSV